MREIKSWKKVACAVAVLLVVALGSLAIWQRDNVKVLFAALTSDLEQLSDGMERVREENQATLAGQGVSVPGLTRGQVEALLNGERTEASVLHALDLEQYTGGDAASELDVVNQCVAELYSYETALYGQLGGMKVWAEGEWKSHPKSERTASLKHSIIVSGLSQCYQLEVEADNRVLAILDQYRAKMSAIGGDTAKIDQLWNVYCSEKASTKAYYINLINQEEEKP